VRARQRVAGADLDIGVRRLGLVLTSTGSELDIEGVLNPGAVRDRTGTLLLFPRMVAAGNVSRIGSSCAVESTDGVTFSPPQVVMEPGAPYELRSRPGGYGCEDARVTFVPRLDAYLMAYTAFGPDGPRIALAISDDAHRWRKLGLLEFADDALNHVPNKDAAFFPEPVLSPSGVVSFALYHRPMLQASIDGQAPIELILGLAPEEREVTCIGYVPAAAAYHDVSALRTVIESVPVLPIDGRWGVLKNGAGTPPVRTAAGWLSFFHGVDAVPGERGRSLYYRAGVVVHDLARPHLVVYRSPEPLMRPETPAERIGVVDDVVFPTGIDVRAPDRFDVYYGAADASVARAEVTLRMPPA
jgi:predicted GH43/DUF377 family glycosyl hydrolase